MQTALFSNHLPRNDVRMVLHFGDDNAIASGQLGAAKGISDQVDSLGRALHKHNFFGRCRINKCGGLLTNVFHLLGSFNAEGVDPTVHGGVVMLIECTLAVDNLTRFLRTGSAVKVSQRLTINVAAQ